MFETTARPLVRQLGALEMHAEATWTQADAVLVSQPVRDLRCRPGPLATRDRGSEIIKHRHRQAGLLPATGLVGQGVKSAHQERFDPEPHRLIVLAQVVGDGGNTPSSIREPDHLQPIARAGDHPSVPGTLLKFLPLRIGQCYSVHAKSVPNFTNFHRLST